MGKRLTNMQFKVATKRLISVVSKAIEEKHEEYEKLLPGGYSRAIYLSVYERHSGVPELSFNYPPVSCDGKKGIKEEARPTRMPEQWYRDEYAKDNLIVETEFDACMSSIRTTVVWNNEKKALAALVKKYNKSFDTKYARAQELINEVKCIEAEFVPFFERAMEELILADSGLSEVIDGLITKLEEIVK